MNQLASELLEDLYSRHGIYRGITRYTRPLGATTSPSSTPTRPAYERFGYEATAAPAPAPSPGPSIAVDPRPNLLIWGNAYRAVAGLSPLAWDDRLASVAQAFAAELASRPASRPLDHVRASGQDFAAVLLASGFPADTSLTAANAGENACSGSVDARDATAFLMASPSHALNILGPFTHLGGARAIVGGRYVWVIDYGRIAR